MKDLGLFAASFTATGPRYRRLKDGRDKRASPSGARWKRQRERNRDIGDDHPKLPRLRRLPSN